MADRRRRGTIRMSARGAGPVCAQLDGRRWHFQHGPIDLVLEIEGELASVRQALNESWSRFQSILPELVSELAELRRPVDEQPRLCGPVAVRMLRACKPFGSERFLTPMAAVAGAVADELIELFRRAGIARAFINNGGDIALHLTRGQRYRVGICANIDQPLRSVFAHTTALDSMFEIEAELPVRGLATSGWRGRSFSLGIADSVTVVAADAAAADAAATMIANAVNCEYDGIVRRPADEIKDDTDLGSRLVTVQVPRLSPALITEALDYGRREGEYWRCRGLIYAAALFLQGRVALVPPVNVEEHSDACCDS
jgi:uncharacterized protein